VCPVPEPPQALGLSNPVIAPLVSNAPPRAGAGAPARGTSYWGHPLESIDYYYYYNYNYYRDDLPHIRNNCADGAVLKI
jgi:hypothetical protein